MPLTPGTRLGVYEITAQIGEGGMGAVYRGIDTTLSRAVAIKILPDAFASDPERVARFEREARTLASLNHPNIAAIYGFEKSGGTHGLVMELVEGEDLSQRIATGAIPLDAALPIAKQIAEALEAAHEQGIIHRDLKPANIKVRDDGTVKVLDFGLAKAMEPAAALAASATMSPTITTPAMTAAGMILGTAAYMSPEQAKGRPADKRSDVWAFGAVLFEMLTGRRAFGGEDVSETLADVMRVEPAWDRLPAGLSPTLRTYLRRCLAKERRERLGDIHDMRLALEGAFETAAAPATLTTTASSRGRLPVLAALAAVAALAIAFAIPAVRHLRETPSATPPEMRVDIMTPATHAPLQFALSPDGRSLVFVASGDGAPRLWLRRLDQSEARPLAGTEGGASPFWSPDGRAIGFFVAGKLLRLDVAGGALQVVATVPVEAGGSWSANGTILFAGTNNLPLQRVAPAGGEPVAVTRLDPPRQVSHRSPRFLPDGQHFLFYVAGTPEAAGIYLGSLDGSAPTRLTAADAGAAFLPPDRMVFVWQGTLMARRLDLAGKALTGEPVTLAARVGVDDRSRAGFAVSDDGLVAYRAGGGASRHLAWVDRTGKAAGLADLPDANVSVWAELSPDGQRVAQMRVVQENRDIWLLDLASGGRTRLTFDAALDMTPIWSPDGTRIAFSSNRTGAFDLYLKPSDGSGTEERLVDSPNNKIPQGWSRDGRWLVYYEVNPTSGRDLWALDMTSPNHTPRVVANTPADESLAALSPDGHWVAYQTNESGRFEVVVQPFPDAGGKWQVSTAGGVAPRWRADGKELYFLAPDETLMAAPVTAAGRLLQLGTPMALFPTRIAEETLVGFRPQYAVARDGRFLINQPADATAAPITLILNWRPPAGQ